MTKASSKRAQRKIAIRDGIVRPEPGKLLRLDLGCGQSKQPDHFGVDIAKCDGVDLVWDLFNQFPYPVEDGTVESIFTSHFFEHIPGKLRPKFMDECYRMLRVGGQMTVIVPYYSSHRASQDFGHEWPPVSEHSFLYFNKGWREANKLTHGPYEMRCDFDFGYGHAFMPDAMARNDEYRQNAMMHMLNAVADIHVTLTKRDPNPPKTDGA